MRNKRTFAAILAIAVFMTASAFDFTKVIGSDESLLHTNINADHTPPTLFIQISTPTGENGWYNSPIFVRAVAHDEDRKNMRAMVSVGGRRWYKDALKLDIDGEFMIFATATDKAGNTARMTQIVKIDMTPPEVTLSIPEATGSEDYHTKPVPVVLTGSDELSGVVSSEVEASGSAHIIGTNASVEIARLSISESGDYLVEGSVKDEAGNVTTISSNLKVDVDAPVVAIDPPMQFKNDIEISGFADDLESGIKYVLVDYGEGWSAVNVEGSGWSTLWPAGEYEDGQYPIQAKIIDRAGNEAQVEYKATIVNTLWPFFTLAALLAGVAFQVVFDPRKKEFVRISQEAQRHNRMYQNGLFVGIEKEYRHD